MGLYNSKQTPKEVQEPFDEIIKTLNNVSLHIEVKRYLLEHQIKKLKSIALRDSFNFLIFPNKINIFHLFGVFGPFKINNDEVYSTIRILSYKSKTGSLIFENHIETFYPRKIEYTINTNIPTPINKEIGPESQSKHDIVVDLYESIIDVLENRKNHMEVKRHLIKENIDSLKKFQIYNLLTGMIYPENIDCVIVSGVFGPFKDNNIECYVALNILYYNDDDNDNIFYESFDIFNPFYVVPKPQEINKIDINKSIIIKQEIQYDTNGIPIPPPLPKLHEITIKQEIQYDMNGIPIPPPLPKLQKNTIKQEIQYDTNGIPIPPPLPNF